MPKHTKANSSVAQSTAQPSVQMDTPKPAPLGDLARHAVFRVLVRQARLYPEFDLGAMERTIDGEPGMDDRDRAFAFAIYDAVARRWLTLEFLIQRSLTQPFSELEPRLKATLLAASAQILFMDKVPTHSAINHAVEWAKRVIRPGAGAFANAVLRKVALLKAPEGSTRREKYTGLRDEVPGLDGDAIAFAEAILPENELDLLSIATSHPRALLEHWLRDLPIREVRRLAMHSMCHPPVILNTAHVRGGLTDKASEFLKPHDAPGHHVFTGPGSVLGAMLHARNDLWVQDPASALAIQSVADLRPKLILDLCAGQGTKTRQLAATFRNAKIIATDVDEPRYSMLQRAFDGSEQVSVVLPKKIREMCQGKADLILLDVPCSNTGVLARRPEARYRFDAEHLTAVVDLQRQIIADSIPLLRENPRGKILYSTCSLEAEENQKQAAWADKWHRTGVSRERRHSPSGGPEDGSHLYCDGAFAALLG